MGAMSEHVSIIFRQLFDELKFLKQQQWTIAFCAAIFLLLPSQVSYSQWGVVAFQSFNFPDRFIRHRNYLGFIEPINDRQAAKDAVFTVRDGLYGGCYSFESRNFPEFYLRHQNFRI